MNDLPRLAPVMPPRAGFIFLCIYLAGMAFCLAAPRALSFLPATISLMGVLYLYVTQKTFPRINVKLPLFILAFGTLAIASSLWSPDPSYSLQKAMKISAVLFSGLLPLMVAQSLSPSIQHKNTLIILATGLCIAAGGYLFIDLFTRFAITRFLLGTPADMNAWPLPIKNGFMLNRTTVYLLLLCLPVMLMLRTSDLSSKIKNIFSALLIFCVAAALSTTNSQTALIAAILVAPMLVFPAQRLKARRLMLFAVLIAMLAAPFVVKPAQDLFVQSGGHTATGGFLIDASVPHRFEVWNFMAEQIMQKPWAGHGMESARHLRAGYTMPYMNTDRVMHPHNAVLQVWQEFGLIGISLVMGVVAYLIMSLDYKPAVMQRYYSVFFIVLLSVLVMGYGLWQPWLIGMIQSLLGLAAMGARLTGADIMDDKA